CQAGAVQDSSSCVCTCSLQCPSDQYSNLGSNCGCLCLSNNQPPQNGVCPRNCPNDATLVGSTCMCNDANKVYVASSNLCVNSLTCPTNARLVGTTCQCNDASLGYNPNTNTCVRNCPSDATPLGTTCGCTNTQKRYDSTSNRCVCQSACPTGSIQDAATCDCFCPNQCPSDQYNNPQSGCRCLCRFTNLEPVGNICSDRQGEICSLSASDCQSPQVLNTETCQCESSGRELCPASEWSCANGRPAYRECHGACVCDCSSQFAGPRCEITVN
ncbi:hypothetical protein EGW08_019878, partial [Elysia chlorotica]